MGRVNLQKRCQTEAPSIMAASKGSMGKAERPARQIRATMGVHCHVSTKTNAGMTTWISESHAMLRIPNQERK